MVPRPPPNQGLAVLTAIGRTVVLVDDHDETLDWYRRILGFEVIHDSEAGGYRYLHIGLPEQPGVGLWLMPATGEDAAARVGGQTAGEPLLVLYTDEFDRMRDHLRAHGVEVWNVSETPESRSLHLRDHDGNVLVIAQVTAS